VCVAQGGLCPATSTRGSHNYRSNGHARANHRRHGHEEFYPALGYAQLPTEFGDLSGGWGERRDWDADAGIDVGRGGRCQSEWERPVSREPVLRVAPGSNGGNIALGIGALLNNTTGDGNTASGTNALQNNTMGSFNTAIGYLALGGNAAGNTNIAVGYQAATNVSGNNSNNIHIGAWGPSTTTNWKCCNFGGGRLVA
jgi:hypothetical protein